MIATGIFGVIVVAVNVFFVVSKINSGLATIHWAVILAITVVGIAYFFFVIYLVSSIISWRIVCIIIFVSMAIQRLRCVVLLHTVPVSLLTLPLSVIFGKHLSCICSSWRAFLLVISVHLKTLHL